MGAYLTNLGLSESAVFELTSAAPEQLQYLTRMRAERLSIKVTYTDLQNSAVVESNQAGSVSQPAHSMEDRALTLVGNVFQSAMHQTAAEFAKSVEASYANHVNYFGQRLNRAEVVERAARYKERWPSLTYTISQPPQVVCDGTSCTVRGTGSFEAKSQPRNAHAWGKFNFSFVLQNFAGRLLIVSEGGTTSDRAVKAIVPRNSTAARQQQALSRLGCAPGQVDGIWGGKSAAAMARFNRTNNSSFSISEPSSVALRAVSSTSAKFCQQKDALDRPG